jgi:hypothetical protein
VRELLTDLPRKLTLLMPGQAPGGEKIAASRVGSPTSARLAALNLVGPGSVSVPAALHPLVRRWVTYREVQVDARVGVYRIDSHTTTIPEWHQEVVQDPETGDPVMVPDDDQIGVLPPAEWLAHTTKVWRRAFGHTRPALAYVRASQGPRPLRDPVRWVIDHGTPEQIKAMFAARDVTARWRQGVADLIVGHEPGHGGVINASISSAW